MAKVHLTLGTKGGIGKSIITIILAQYLAEKQAQAKHNAPLCFDLDPSCRTFSGYAALNAQFIDLLKDGEIVQHNFDELVGKIDAAKKDDSLIIDTGGNTYNAFVAYLRASNVIPFLTQQINDPTDQKRKIARHDFFVHLPISGGGELKTTLVCFDNVGKFFPDARLVAWLNPYHGSMVLDNINCYTDFEKTTVFKENADHLAGIVKMPEWSTLMKHDVAAMFKSNRTFGQCADDKSLNIMERQRLVMAKRMLWDLLDQIEEISQ